MRGRSSWLVLAMALSACGSTGGGGGSGGMGGTGGAGSGGTCQSALDCQVDLVCGPVTLTCSTALACTGHAECGRAAYCAGNGQCARNTSHGLCAGDDNCIAGERCTAGHCGCGGQMFQATNVPPNLLITLDRSSSMNEMITGGTKWNIAKSAISTLLSTYGSQIRFGLHLWPGQNQSCSGTGAGARCNSGMTAKDTGTPTSEISTYLGNTQTCSLGTPIGATLSTLKNYAGLEDAARANYVLLITDGAENCSGDGSAAATALTMESPPVKTFVIGFGAGVDAMELNAIATAGGTARSGTTKYYQADDSASLAAAFAEIAGSVVSCTYTLSGVPSDLTLLRVYIGANAVSRDTMHANGWDFDTMQQQLTLYGTACNDLRSGTSGSLVVSYGCPPIQ